MAAKAEIIEKEERVRNFLRSRELDALLLKRQANFSWMTGGGLNLVGITTEIGAAALLITVRGKFLVCSNIEAPRMIEEEKLEDQGFEILSFPFAPAAAERPICSIPAKTDRPRHCSIQWSS